MQSDIKAWSVRARDHANSDAEALAAFGSEVSEPTSDQGAQGARDDALELFPHERSTDPVAPTSDARPTSLAAPAPTVSLQPRAPFAATLVGVTLVGLVIGLWSSLQFEDPPIQIVGDASSATDQAQPVPVLPQRAVSPTVVPLRKGVQAQSVALPSAPIPSGPEPSDRGTRDRAVSRQTTPRRQNEVPVRTTRASEPAARPQRPATPAVQGPASRTTPPSLAAVESSSTTPAPARQPDSSTPVTPSTPIDRPAPSVAPAAPVTAPPSSVPAATSAAGPTAAAAAAPTPASGSTSTTAREAADIQGVLTRYASAFADLDPVAVRNVWPTVDSRALTRAFRGLEEQAIAFDNCNISAAGTSAAASCGGTVRYVTRIGSKEPRTEHRRWQFRMRKVGERWVIETVESH